MIGPGGLGRMLRMNCIEGMEMKRRELLKVGLGLPICGIARAGAVEQKTPALEPDWDKINTTRDFRTFVRSLRDAILCMPACALDYRFSAKGFEGFCITVNKKPCLLFRIDELHYQKLSPKERFEEAQRMWVEQLAGHRKMAELSTMIVQHFDPDYDPRFKGKTEADAKSTWRDWAASYTVDNNTMLNTFRIGCRNKGG